MLASSYWQSSSQNSLQDPTQQETVASCMMNGPDICLSGTVSHESLLTQRLEAWNEALYVPAGGTMLGCLDGSLPCQWHSAIDASSDALEEQRLANSVP
jgi:hypothetical protein